MRGTILKPVRNSETFPSQTELTVAKALLLLSSIPISFNSTNQASSPPLIISSSLSPTDPSSSSSTARDVQLDRLRSLAVAAHPRDLTNKDTKSVSNENSSPSESKCSSTITSEVSSSGNVHVDCIGGFSGVSCSNELKLKVIRKSRSKRYRKCDRREDLSGLLIRPPICVKEDEPEVSSISNASSAVLALAVPNQQLMMRGDQNVVSDRSGELKKRKTCSSYLKRRAEVILKFLSAGSASEVKIREVIGNSPDTSKALRMLLRLERVKRSGAGGQKDPYIYMVAGTDSDVEST